MSKIDLFGSESAGHGDLHSGMLWRHTTKNKTFGMCVCLEVSYVHIQCIQYSRGVLSGRRPELGRPRQAARLEAFLALSCIPLERVVCLKALDEKPQAMGADR